MRDRADRVQPGDLQISAERTMNPIIEQANKVSGLQGGPGVMAQNDLTGLQLRGRRRDIADGDSSYSSSSPWRRTLKRRKDGTRHSNEWEQYNSSTVSARAVVPSSSRPQRYGIPFLPVDSSGSGELTWGSMDADEFGSSGPRSIERRSSSSGERFQVFGFDGAAVSLDSSEVAQVAVRRRYGSSGNHYIAWVNSSEIGGGTFPRWDQIQDATASVTCYPNSSAQRDFFIGSESATRAWRDVFIDSVRGITSMTAFNQYASTGQRSAAVTCDASAAAMLLQLILTGSSGTIQVDVGSNGALTIANLPTSAPASVNTVWRTSSGDLRIT